MARYKASLEVQQPREELFDYLSDFSTAQQWDPGIVRAERLTTGEPGKGSEFRLVARFLGRRAILTYRTVEYDPPSAVTFHGENDTVTSRDRITFTEMGAQTRIDYDAELRLKRSVRLADTMLGLAFARVGRRALKGLEQALATQASAFVPASGAQSRS